VNHQHWPYWLRVLIGIDQLVNAVFNGNPDETVSSRLGRAHRDGRLTWWRKPLPYLLYRLLERLDPGHCARSIEEELR
jgi:hypothetical protein